MSEILLAGFSVFVGFSMGYVVCDYRRWSSDYRAWSNATVRRNNMRVVSPENGPWDNGRAA